jgi:hypothetical protein
VRRLLVIDANEQLLGIISWADIAPYASDRTVGQVVSKVVEHPDPGDRGERGGGAHPSASLLPRARSARA